MLWYLHLAATTGVVVVEYTDNATGTMIEDEDGGGQFSQVVLRPTVNVAELQMAAQADSLHDEVHAKCFIDRPVNFPVHHRPQTWGSPIRLSTRPHALAESQTHNRNLRTHG